MKILTAVIVDDIRSNIDRLKELLSGHCPQVEIAGTAGSVVSAVKLLKEAKPDLVFLDVELPDGTGFDILQSFYPVPFQVIFFTGHMEYAFQAIKFHALDYLLKPVAVKELIAAVDLAAKQILDESYQTRVDSARRQFADPGHIIIPDSSGFQVLDTNEIILLEADANYTHIYLKGKQKLTFCRILKEFSDLLKGNDQFIRTHKSYIINITHVKSYSRQGTIRLTDGLTASIGDTYRDEFMRCFTQK